MIIITTRNEKEYELLKRKINKKKKKKYASFGL